MFKDLSMADPLVIFRCKNKLCRHIFTPSSLLIEIEQKLYFECPLCGSQYEAKYNHKESFIDQKVIMLLEKPRLISLGTRIASS